MTISNSKLYFSRLRTVLITVKLALLSRRKFLWTALRIAKLVQLELQLVRNHLVNRLRMFRYSKPGTLSYI